MKRGRLLETIQDATEYYGAGLCTGRGVTKRDVDRAIRAGLVKCVGTRRVLDLDHKPTGRRAPCYRLTNAGIRELWHMGMGSGIPSEIIRRAQRRRS